MDECEELAKEIIDKHFVIQILLAFPKLDFEVSVFLDIHRRRGSRSHKCFVPY